MTTELRAAIATKGKNVVSQFYYVKAPERILPTYGIFRDISSPKSENTHIKFEDVYVEIQYFCNSVQECEQLARDCAQEFDGKENEFMLNEYQVLRVVLLDESGAQPVEKFWRIILQLKFQLEKK